MADIQGLGFERPWVGLIFGVAAISMAGFPPTAGFIAKFEIFKAAFSGGHTWVAVLALLNNALSAAVYLRVLVALYMLPVPGERGSARFGGSLGLLTAALALGLLLLGILPSNLAMPGL